MTAHGGAGISDDRIIVHLGGVGSSPGRAASAMAMHARNGYRHGSNEEETPYLTRSAVNDRQNGFGSAVRSTRVDEAVRSGDDASYWRRGCLRGGPVVRSPIDFSNRPAITVSDWARCNCGRASMGKDLNLSNPTREMAWRPRVSSLTEFTPTPTPIHPDEHLRIRSNCQASLGPIYFCCCYQKSCISPIVISLFHPSPRFTWRRFCLLVCVSPSWIHGDPSCPRAPCHGTRGSPGAAPDPAQVEDAPAAAYAAILPKPLAKTSRADSDEWWDAHKTKPGSIESSASSSPRSADSVRSSTVPAADPRARTRPRRRPSPAGPTPWRGGTRTRRQRAQLRHRRQARLPS